MRRFVEFVVRFKNYIALVAFVVMSLSFMSFGELSRLGGFRAVIVGGIGWMQSIFAWVPNPVALKSENEALRKLNLQLSIESGKYREAMVENARMRRMLELTQSTERPLIAADVVGRTTTELRNFATLDKGTNDGIEDGMAVITDAGLAGIIIASSPEYSVVRLLLNRDTRVASRIYRTNADGVIKWEGEETLAMKDVPRLTDVRVDDLIITSEYSSRFPENIVIGRVVEVRDEENSLFRQITVQPAVDFNTLSQVFVIASLPEVEMMNLEDSVMASVPGQ